MVFFMVDLSWFIQIDNNVRVFIMNFWLEKDLGIWMKIILLLQIVLHDYVPQNGVISCSDLFLWSEAFVGNLEWLENWNPKELSKMSILSTFY